MSGRLFGIDNVLDTDDWYTPPWIFLGLGLVFDLDVASPDIAPSWIPARNRFTVADDGLLQPWSGVVWCNPPYSAPTQWCRKWAQHPAGCILLRADLSSSGPFAAFTAATSIYVAARRIQFVNGLGAPSGSVHFSTVILGRGPAADGAIVRLSEMAGGTARLLKESLS